MNHVEPTTQNRLHRRANVWPAGIQPPAFNTEALHQQQKGHVVLNPATLPDGLTQQQYMQLCCPMVMMADEVIMLPAWINSQGATAEFNLAMKCGKVIRQAEDGFAWYPTSPEGAA